jgi:hypothetical protein
VPPTPSCDTLIFVTLPTQEESADDDYNGFFNSPSPTEDLSNHPHFKKEYSLYDLPSEMDLDNILTQRRKRDTPSAASPQYAPKRRGRKRKHPLPPPPPVPKAEKETRTSTPTLNLHAYIGSDSEISALTENSEVDVDTSIQIERDIKPLRSSVVASTPGSMGGEIDVVDVVSPGMLLVTVLSQKVNFILI